jgi:hypothetical protein
MGTNNCPAMRTAGHPDLNCKWFSVINNIHTHTSTCMHILAHVHNTHTHTHTHTCTAQFHRSFHIQHFHYKLLHQGTKYMKNSWISSSEYMKLSLKCVFLVETFLICLLAFRTPVSIAHKN